MSLPAIPEILTEPQNPSLAGLTSELYSSTLCSRIDGLEQPSLLPTPTAFCEQRDVPLDYLHVVYEKTEA